MSEKDNFTRSELIFLKFLLSQERLRYSRLSLLFKDDIVTYQQGVEMLENIDKISHKIIFKLGYEDD